MKKRFDDRDNCVKEVCCGETISPIEVLTHRKEEVKRCKKNLKRHLKNKNALIDMFQDYSYPRDEMYSIIGGNTISIDSAKNALDYSKQRLKILKKKKKSK